MVEAPTGTTWVTHPWVAAAAAEVGFGIANGPRGDWPALAEFVATAEALGFDAFWSSDHPVLSPGCWTTLAALAATTRAIRLGSLVACIDYLNPVVLARMALDIDRISDGRLIVGLGIGDIEREFAQMGIAWRPTAQRQATLREVVALLRYLWGESGNEPSPNALGIDASPMRPGPLQQPRIPLLIAGGGERVTLRQVAAFADASNFGEHAYAGGVRGDAAIAGRMAALASHCADVGRPADSVLRTHTTYPLVVAGTAAEVAAKVDRFLPAWVRELTRDSIVAGTPEAVIPHFTRLRDAGFQHFIAFVYGNDTDTLRLLAERVVPAVRRHRPRSVREA